MLIGIPAVTVNHRQALTIFKAPCLREGGGGGVPAGQDQTTSTNAETTSTSTCTETPTVTAACDVACTDAADTACSTFCDTITVSCPTTALTFSAYNYGTVTIEDYSDLLGESDAQLSSDAWAFASEINPLLSSMDPVMVSSNTLTISAAPSTTTTTSQTTSTGLSATSCALESYVFFSNMASCKWQTY